MPSGATRKATFFCSPVVVLVVSVVLVMVVPSRSDGFGGARVRRRCAATRPLPTPFPGKPGAGRRRRLGGSVPRMALHCAATLVLVPVGTAPDDAAGVGAVMVGPLAPGTDVVEALQALADLHRGERVVVPVAPEQLDAVHEYLGRGAGPVADVVVLEIGDDGWVVPSRPG